MPSPDKEVVNTDDFGGTEETTVNMNQIYLGGKSSMKKRLITMLLAVTMVLASFTLVGLTGCDIEKEGEETKKGGDLKLVTFYDVHLANPATAVGAAKVAYEEQYGATIDSKLYPYEIYKNKLVQLISSNSSPDIIVGYWGDMPKLAAIEILQPVDTFLDLSKQNFQGVLDSYTWKGKHYAACIQQVQVPLLWFNKPLLEKYGVTENPYQLWKADKWNWESFAEIGRKLTVDTDNNGEIDQWGYAAINSLAFMWSNSASFIETKPDGSVRIAWKDQKCLNGLKFMQEARFDDPFYAPDPTFANTGFDNNKLAMAYGTFEYLAYNASSLDPNDVGVAPFPAGPDFEGYYYGVSNFFSIAKGAKNPQGAGLFCETVTAKEKELFPNEVNLGNPIASDVLTAEHKEVINYATGLARVTLDEGWGDWGYKMGNLLNLIFWEKGDIISALDSMEPVLKAEIDDTLNFQVVAVGDFITPEKQTFETDTGLFTNAGLTDVTMELGTDAIEGTKSLLLGGKDIAQVVAYTDVAKLKIQPMKTYKITFDYKIISAVGDNAGFAFTSRTMTNLLTDVDQKGWIIFEGVPGATGSVEGTIELMNYKDDYIFSFCAGINMGTAVVDNLVITEVIATE